MQQFEIQPIFYHSWNSNRRYSQFDSVIKNYSGSSLLYASLPFYFRISKCIKCLSVIKVYECHCKDFFFTALAVPKIKIWANFPHFWLELSEKNKKAAQKTPQKKQKNDAHVPRPWTTSRNCIQQFSTADSAATFAAAATAIAGRWDQIHFG